MGKKRKGGGREGEGDRRRWGKRGGEDSRGRQEETEWGAGREMGGGEGGRRGEGDRRRGGGGQVRCSPVACVRPGELEPGPGSPSGIRLPSEEVVGGASGASGGVWAGPRAPLGGYGRGPFGDVGSRAAAR